MPGVDDIKIDCANLNTTECILRAATQILAEVKKSGNEFNWDPPTFAVTLAIGFIALFFAALTIGQGLIAAAPGKHCSRYALGPWAHFSERRIDWSELRIQATAYTPVIRMEAVLRHLLQPEGGGPDQLQDDRSDSPPAKMTLREWKRTQRTKPTRDNETTRQIYPPSKDLDQYFPATWLALLTYVGLDHPGIWTRKHTRTDYIPTDLVAAPAYASIRDMVTLAALAASPSKLRFVYQSTSLLSSVHGPEFDLDFRQHPAIGIHGVFQTFNALYRKWNIDESLTRRDIFLVSRQKMLNAVLNAYGRMPQRKGLEYDQEALFSDVQSFGIREGWLSYEWHYERRRLSRLCESSARADRGKASSEKYLESYALCQCWCRLGDSDFISLVGSSLGHGGPYQGGSWVLLMAEAPRPLPTLFPRRLMDTVGRVQRLLVLSRFWSLDPSALDPSNLADGLAGFPHETPSTSSSDSPSSTDPANRTSSWSPVVRRNTFTPGDKGIEACRRYVKAIDEDKDLEVQPDAALTAELAQLDAYLGGIPSELLTCRMICLGCAAMVCESMLRLKATLASGDNSLHPWSRNPADGDPANEKNIPLNFSSHSSRRRVTELCYVLEAFISWYRQDPFGLDDDDMPKGRRFPGVFDKLSAEILGHAPVTGAQYSSIAGELEKVLKTWELDGDGKFVYAKIEEQHHVDDLLIYRSIMIAIMYSSAVDNSDILQDATYTKTVPFL